MFVLRKTLANGTGDSPRRARSMRKIMPIASERAVGKSKRSSRSRKAWINQLTASAKFRS